MDYQFTDASAQDQGIDTGGDFLVRETVKKGSKLYKKGDRVKVMFPMRASTLSDKKPWFRHRESGRAEIFSWSELEYDPSSIIVWGNTPPGRAYVDPMLFQSEPPMKLGNNPFDDMCNETASKIVLTAGQKALDSQTQALLLAGYVNSDLSLTTAGMTSLLELLLSANKAALARAAEEKLAAEKA
jgi:hypothetical protein